MTVVSTNFNLGLLKPQYYLKRVVEGSREQLTLFSVKLEFIKLFFVTRDLKVTSQAFRTVRFSYREWVSDLQYGALTQPFAILLFSNTASSVRRLLKRVSYLHIFVIRGNEIFISVILYFSVRARETPCSTLGKQTYCLKLRLLAHRPCLTL